MSEPSDKDLQLLSAGMKFARESAAETKAAMAALVAILVKAQEKQIELGLLPKIDSEERKFAAESSLMCVAVMALASHMHDRHEAAPLAGIARALASMAIAQDLPRKALMQALNDAMNQTYATVTPGVVAATRAMDRPQ